MSKACRVGDSTSGTCDMKYDCCPHNRTGTNSSGSSNVFINGKRAHRRGDSGSISCPHGGNFTSSQGSKTVFVNGKAAVRTGDSTICNVCGMDGQHSSGSSNVFVG